MSSARCRRTIVERKGGDRRDDFARADRCAVRAFRGRQDVAPRRVRRPRFNGAHADGGVQGVARGFDVAGARHEAERLARAGEHAGQRQLRFHDLGPPPAVRGGQRHRDNPSDQLIQPYQAVPAPFRWRLQHVVRVVAVDPEAIAGERQEHAAGIGDSETRLRRGIVLRQPAHLGPIGSRFARNEDIRFVAEDLPEAVPRVYRALLA